MSRGSRIALAIVLVATGALLAYLLVRDGDGTLPTTTTATTATSTTAITTSAVTTTTTVAGYTAAQLAYFTEVAGGAEFGETGTVHRWETDLRIALAGSPDADDRGALEGVVADLNEALDAIDVTIVTSDPNVTLHFAPESEFAAILPSYQPINLGFFWVWWDGTGAITDATVLISTTGTTQTEQEHLLREELTQTLGLMNDSWSYPESVFYQGWTDTTEYTALDLALIDMLYDPAVEPGMTIGAAVAALGAP